jgi:hypothetical protein
MGKLMNKFVILLVSVLLAIEVSVAQEKTGKASSQGIRVEKTVVATSISALDPVGESKDFGSSVGTVYCWTKVSARTVPATIVHVWYLADQKVFTYPLELKFNSTRTWSSKSVRSGSWRVDVTDESGTVLSSKSFTVR